MYSIKIENHNKTKFRLIGTFELLAPLNLTFKMRMHLSSLISSRIFAVIS